MYIDNSIDKNDDYILEKFQSLLLNQEKEKKKEKTMEKQRLNPINDNIIDFNSQNESKLPTIKNKYSESAERVQKIMNKTQQKYKFKYGGSKEQKFNSKISFFKPLKTFIDVRPLLQNINLTNKEIVLSEKDKIQALFIEEEKIKKSLLKDQTLLLNLEKNEEIEEEIEYNNDKKKKKYYKCQKDLVEERVLENKAKLYEYDPFNQDNNSLQISMTNYLKRKIYKNKEKKLSNFEQSHNFENLLFEKLMKNDDVLTRIKNKGNTTRATHHDIEIYNLERFVKRKLEENVLQEELKTGVYFEKYRNQATKVLSLLKKTTKNIYANKLDKAKLKQIALQQKTQKKETENELNSNISKNKSLKFPALSIIPKKNEYNKSKSLHKNVIIDIPDFDLSNMLTNNSINWSKSQSNQIKQNLKTKTDNFLLKKIKDFISNVDYFKTNHRKIKSSFITEINHLQEDMENETNQLKGMKTNKNDVIRTSLNPHHDNSSFLRRKTRNSQSSMSISAIVGLI